MIRCAAIAATAVLVSSCRFGTLPYSKCLRDYQPSQIHNAALAQGQSGGVVRESYGFCADGRSRIVAITPHLEAQGFTVDEPRRHFEVPGGSCTSAKRQVAPATYDPQASLDTICRMGDAFRAYLTGGTLEGADGRQYVLRSIYDPPPAGTDR